MANALLGIPIEDVDAWSIYSNGDLKIIPYEDAPLDSYDQFVEVVAKPESTKLLLSTDTTVQDIRIYELIWSDYNQIKKNVCAINSLTNENAIRIEAEFNGERPNYIIEYSIDGKPNQFYIVKDPATNKMSLASEYIPNW